MSLKQISLGFRHDFFYLFFYFHFSYFFCNFNKKFHKIVWTISVYQSWSSKNSKKIYRKNIGKIYKPIWIHKKTNFLLHRRCFFFFFVFWYFSIVRCISGFNLLKWKRSFIQQKIVTDSPPPLSQKNKNLTSIRVPRKKRRYLVRSSLARRKLYNLNDCMEDLITDL